MTPQEQVMDTPTRETSVRALLDELLGMPMEMGRFLRLAVGMGAAVAELHRQGIIHKSIEPTHTLVDVTTGNVRLPQSSPAPGLPYESVPDGNLPRSAASPAYMSPEQTGRMNRVVDHRTDLYSLGATFYEMLTGELPCRADDILGWVYCHVAREPRSLLEAYPAIPATVSAIVMRLLAKTPEERYQTALGLKLDLEKCRTEWEASGTIAPFTLGEWDVSERLLVPQRLYGREKDVETLLSAFERVVMKGTPELIMVAGYSGIGKTSLVRELCKPLVQERGLFISGKFDQYKRDLPYTTIVEAFQGLIQHILTESEERLAEWKLTLLEAVGMNAQVIIDVIPQVELIIGTQQPVPEVPPTEAENRFNMVFRQFLGAFTTREHPLVLFLDDLQWADSASLKLLEHIITSPDTSYLFLIGAYRDNEVDPSHHLMHALDRIRRNRVRLRTITLSPLSFPDLGRLMADSFRSNGRHSGPLTSLVYEKTAGNPFFVIQFLMMLYDEGLIDLDRTEKAWKWDVDRIQAKGYTDNVVDLMVRKLIRLSPNAQQTLRLAACIGNTFHVHTLAVISKSSDEDTSEDLHEALREGLVLRLSDSAYKFLHDRVQQAAYSLTPEDRLAEVHLRIGRLLLADASPEESEEQVFDIVNHLNLGAALITDRAEKDRLLRLNLAAGRRAKASIAYVPALNFLSAAVDLLPEDAWESHYDLTFSLFVEYAECAYLCGDHSKAEQLFAPATEKGRTRLDKAVVYNLRLRLYQVAGKYDEAVTLGLEALSMFGVKPPESDQGIQEEIREEHRAVQHALRGRKIAELVGAPVVTDPEIKAIIELLSSLCPCAAMARPMTYPWYATRMVNYTLTHGNTEEASVAYIGYALWLIGTFGEIGTAFELSQLALELNERFDGRPRRGRLLFLFGDLVNFWRRPWATGLPILDQAFSACLDVGDLLHAGFTSTATIWHMVEKGDPFDEVLRLSQKHAVLARQNKNEAIFQTIRVAQQFVAALKGLTRGPLSLDDEGFDESAAVSTITQANFSWGILFCHAIKQILAFTHGRFADAFKSATEAVKAFPLGAINPIGATQTFYHALTAAALHLSAPDGNTSELLAILDGGLEKFRRWTDHCPENFRARLLLLSAERARITANDLEAMRLYEEAVRLAHESGFVQYEALGYELASRFYRERGFERFADTYLREARKAYVRWGADGKVRELDRAYPWLAEGVEAAASNVVATQVARVDAVTLAKASQAISGEIVLTNLLETLMRTVLENAGAQRGCLILQRNGELSLEAEAALDGREIKVVQPGPALLPSALPLSMVNYVARTRTSVILDDASQDEMFSSDPYVVQHKPKSVLCLPLLRKAKPVGMLYLENA
ncbi:MAG: AAA family ATPase, partial [Thermodesulfobacteriota bacterium]